MIPLYDDQPSLRFPFATLLLIAVNVFVFAFWQLHVGLDESVDYAGFVPTEFVHRVPGATTHIFTSMFMHGGWMHLIGNMWFFWVFGKNIEDICGPLRYICFYLLCGVAATFLYAVAAPNSHVPLVGASGAISGVLGAFLLKFPRSNVRTLVPLGIFTTVRDIPAWVFLLLWIGMQIFFSANSRHSENAGGVAYMAHIGGFIAGFPLIFIFQDNAAIAQLRRNDNNW